MPSLDDFESGFWQKFQRAAGATGNNRPRRVTGETKAPAPERLLMTEADVRGPLLQDGRSGELAISISPSGIAIRRAQAQYPTITILGDSNRPTN
ncbi:MAG: hypothetical protein IH604_18525 [Burkholderiales bacterium]|nr:hypothetical protein [Burkholderiales bacterium]